MWAHSSIIGIILLIDIRTCWCSAFSLPMLNYWLLLLIRLLLILNSSRLIWIEALMLNLWGLLPWLVRTNTILSVELSINSLSCIPTRGRRDNFGLFSNHLNLLILLLPLSALRTIIGIWYVILSYIDLVIINWLSHYFRGGCFIHRFHSGGAARGRCGHLRIWGLFAVNLVIHCLHQSVVCINGALDVWGMWLLDPILTLACLLWFLETRMLIYKTIAILLIVPRVSCIYCGVNTRRNRPRLCNYVVSRVPCLFGIIDFIDLILIKLILEL